MQITKAEVIPVELQMKRSVRMANLPEMKSVTAIFVRLETRQGQSAWGCTVAHPDLNGEKSEHVIRVCREYSALAPDFNPLNIELALEQLSANIKASPAALCAYDLALYDLLGQAAGLPLYRILGGYRNRIQTSITIPLTSLEETVEQARERASQGFRILKIKGGLQPEEDVRRAKAVHQLLPHHLLRLDADGGYSVETALDVSRALEGVLETLEQPTPPKDLAALRNVAEHSPVPVLADQSVSVPGSALEIAARRAANGLCIKLAGCGGLRCAQQIDSIARAARLSTMVSCYIQPALLTAAGLSLALSSPNVKYGDLDGHMDLTNDPSYAGFRLEEGWLVASEVPGLGYTVELG